MNCKQCGTPIKDGMNFCSKCGWRVKSRDVFSVSDKTLTVDDMKKREDSNAENAHRQGNPQNLGTPVNPNQRPQQGNPVNPNQRPQQGIPVNPNQRPQQGTPGNPNQRPQQGNPVNPNQRPQQGNPVNPNQRPQQGTPRNPNQRPQQGKPVNPNQRPQQGTPVNHNQRQQNQQMGQQMQDLKNASMIPQTEVHDPNKKYDNNQNNPWNTPYTPKPPKKVKKQTSATSGICVFLSVLLFLSMFISLALTFVHTTYSNEKIEKWINEEDLYKLKVPVTDEEGTKNKSVSDVVYDSVIYYIDSDLIVSKGDVRNLLKKRIIKDFMTDVVIEYREYVFYGEMAEGITAERFADFMIENKAEILSALAKDLRIYELEEFVDEQGLFDREYIIDEANLYLGDSSSIAAIDREYGHIISSFRFFISENFMIIMWGVSAILLLAIALLSMSNMVNIFSYVGSAFATLGGFLLIAKLVISSLVGRSTGSAIYRIADLLMSKLVKFGLMLLIAGILMIVIRIILWTVQKIRLKKYSNTI